VLLYHVIFCYSVVGYQNICEELREELEFPDKDGVYKAALSLVARIMQDSFIKVSIILLITSKLDFVFYGVFRSLLKKNYISVNFTRTSIVER